MNEKKNENQAEFALQHIYVKEMSFESQDTPSVFTEQLKPEVSLELNVSHEDLKKDDLHEVAIYFKVTVKSQEKVAFTATVKQAGTFLIRKVPEESLEQVLNSFCPNILFPYAREALDNIIIKGHFPPIMLPPIDFDAVYAEAKKQKEKQNQSNSNDNNNAVISDNKITSLQNSKTKKIAAKSSADNHQIEI